MCEFVQCARSAKGNVHYDKIALPGEITCKRMKNKQIMTEILKILNNNDIFVQSLMKSEVLV